MRNPGLQPLSAKAYAVISLTACVVVIALLLFYVYSVPRLVESGAQDQFFYILLIPWALMCSIALFGAMKSFARFTSRQLGGLLELGGPVVLFCLVLVGGFKLVPPNGPFALTVRAHSADGKEPLIKTGRVTVDLENDRRTSAFQTNGEANFKGIPPQFRGKNVRFIPEVEGYVETPQLRRLTTSFVDLALDRDNSTIILFGSIIVAPAERAVLRLFVDGGIGEGTADELGRF